MTMTTLSVHHQVADYAHWRKVFDSMDGQHRRAGMTSVRVLRSASDPNELTILSEWSSLEQAKAWATSPDLRAGMQNAGVSSQPDVAFLEAL
jgi:heme-degrading monooxygenase HmoA